MLVTILGYEFTVMQLFFAGLGTAVVLAVALISACFYVGARRRRQVRLVKKHSILYKKILDVNDRVEFGQFQPEYKFAHHFDSKKTFDRANPREVMAEQIRRNLGAVDMLVDHIEQNREVYEIYAKVYCQLWQYLGLTSVEGLRAGMSQRKFNDIEKKLFHKHHKKPNLEIKFILVKRCFADNCNYETTITFEYAAFKECFVAAGGNIRQKQYTEGQERPSQKQQEQQQQQYHQRYQQQRQQQSDSQSQGAHYRKSSEPAQEKKVYTELYRTLEVPNTATAEEIKAAYRKLAKMYHPDRNPGGAEKFKTISAAYEVLSSEARRALYDREGTT